MIKNEEQYATLADKCRSTSTYLEAMLKCYEVGEIKSLRRTAIMISRRMKSFDQFLNDNYIKEKEK